MANLVHFSLKFWHLAATNFMIFLRRDWSNMGRQCHLHWKRNWMSW